VFKKGKIGGDILLKGDTFAVVNYRKKPVWEELAHWA